MIECLYAVVRVCSSLCCRSEDPTYEALWADKNDFNEVLISPTMINDHMPDNVLDAMEKVCPSLAVSSQSVGIVNVYAALQRRIQDLPGGGADHGELSTSLPEAESFLFIFIQKVAEI